jgi:CheY-like chemotaxis protein
MAGGETINLVFEIADTGIGIKSEDMPRLFGNFEQLDTRNNLGIEGTGLGLAISRSLCRLMGGDITVTSEYGKGSVFTASLPQIIRDNAPFAFVESPETKNALVYTDEINYGASLAYTIDNLGVGCSFVKTREDFIEGLKNTSWQFVFTSSNLFEEVRETLLKKGSLARLVLLAEYGKAARPGLRTLQLPVQPVSVANIFNGKPTDTGYHETENPGVRFTAPGARILIVDDIDTNLDVAAGLLMPYKMYIDKSSSGLDAIELARKNYYDLIFMDHMMPGMDGIEAAAAIRKLGFDAEGAEPRNSYYIKLPIIALTANAVSGMKEMFLEKGFNDYLSKPIDIAKLDGIISRWIPMVKRIKSGEGIKRETFSGDGGLSIPGIDISSGINMTGGTIEGYKLVLTSFYKDAQKRLPFLQEPPEAADMSGFTTNIHALKSASGAIGAAGLSKEAAELEALSLAAAKVAGNMGRIQEKLPGFYAHLAETADDIRAALENEAKGAESGGPALNKADSVVRGAFLNLKKAIESKDMETMDRFTGELNNKNLDATAREALNAVSDLLLLAKFKAAIEKIDELLSGEDSNAK